MALDPRRLGKRRVETIQVLRGLAVPGYGRRRHPGVRMWAGYEEALVRYGPGNLPGLVRGEGFPRSDGQKSGRAPSTTLSVAKVPFLQAGQRPATSDCLARTASAASLRPASSDSVRSVMTTLRAPVAPISASTPR